MSVAPKLLEGDIRLVQIAREIAIDHFDIEQIQARYGLSADEWDKIAHNPRFTELLQSEIEAWQSASNTHERVKLKTAALIETWLEEANKRIHDPSETLNSKVELAKLLARLAGMGLQGASIEGGGPERFSVTINIGDDRQVRIERDVTPQSIEYEET